MIAKKMAENAEEETPDIHAEDISNQDVTNINNGKVSLTKCTIPTDGTAVELPIPDNLQVFISEDGKPMIRKKIEGDEKPTDTAESKPITYDDICKEFFFHKDTVHHGDLPGRTAKRQGRNACPNPRGLGQAGMVRGKGHEADPARGRSGRGRLSAQPLDGKPTHEETRQGGLAAFHA